MLENNFSIKNVKVETGFKTENDQIVGTKTETVTLDIKNGVIDKIRKENPHGEGLNGKGCLLLPAFKDMHSHLDKTLFGLPRQAKRPQNKTVKDMIKYEQKIIPDLLKSSTQRADKLIYEMQLAGTDFTRSHVNIDATSKLDSLYNLQKTLDGQRDFFDCELVAFPQHGLYYTPSAQYMEEAAKSDWITHIGGLDPISIDGDLKKPLDFTVKLALDYQKGIDIHLHETGDDGLKTVEYLIKQVRQNPELKGNTFISHAYVLAFLDEVKLEEIAEQLVETEIGIITTLPFTKFKMPYRKLMEKGVCVKVGTDNIQDHWDTFGSVNMLEKAKLAAQLYGYETEYDLSRILKVATNGCTPLDDEGNQVWPKPNDKADFVLMEASCSAEAIARLSSVMMLVHQGEIVFSRF